jgi:steroid 5-alpha reductase family enzyme
MNTRGGSDEDEKKGGQINSLVKVLGITALLTQVLAFMSSGSAKAFSYLKLSSCGIVGFQWLVWLHASGIIFGNAPTEKYYDLTGAITWITSTVAGSVYMNGGWAAMSVRQQILSVMVEVWALRLGLFLFSRIHKDGGVDTRFTEMKKSPARFLVAWTLQGLWIFITGIPVTSLLALGGGFRAPPLGVQDYVGMGLWCVGFLFEVTADAQKRAFKANPENKFKFINEGLWKLSRHPNYFGEIVLWLGLYVSASAGMPTTLQRVATAISPVFVALLLIFVSGITLLEKASDARFGTSAGYKAYKLATPVLIPLVGRAGEAPF